MLADLLTTTEAREVAWRLGEALLKDGQSYYFIAVMGHDGGDFFVWSRFSIL